MRVGLMWDFDSAAFCESSDMPGPTVTCESVVFEALHLAWQAECLPPACRPSLDRLVQEVLCEDHARRGSAGAGAMNRYLRFRLRALSCDN